MKSRFFRIDAIAAFLMSAATLAAPAAAFAQTMEWTIAEELRIGSAEGSTRESFSSVSALAVGSDGTIFVLDAPPVEVRSFDRSGRFLRVVARAGQGPGELTRPSAMLFVGDSLWIIDPMATRIGVYGPDGTFARQLSRMLTWAPRWDGTIDRAGRVLDPIQVPSGRSEPKTGLPLSDTRLRRLARDGSIIDTVALPACASPRPGATPRFAVAGTDGSISVVTLPHVATQQRAFDADGMLWCSPRDEYVAYRMEIGRPDTVRTIRRGGPGPAIPRTIRDSLVRRYSPRGARVSASTFTESMIPRNYPAIADMRVDDSGRLWIRKTDTPTRAPTFDLFDRSGAHLGSAKAGFPIQGVPLVVGDVVYAITLNADDVPFVVRARLKR